MSSSDVVFILSCSSWAAFELWLNFRDRAQVDATEDKTSGIYLFVLIVASLGICGISQFADWPRIPISAESRLWAGTVIIGMGAVLRWWAAWYLGNYFRMVVAIQEGQKLVKRGPYRFIRHPSYAGAMLVFLGFGLGLGSWPGLAVMGLLPFLGYRRRIRLEEQLMMTGFREEYRRFMGETKKLIPFIY